LFLKQNKFSFYFKNTSFFVWARKPDNHQEKPVLPASAIQDSSHTENHTRPTNLSACSVGFCLKNWASGAGPQAPVPLLQGGADFLIFVASKELIFRFQI
jgi:hypothetical protein